MIIDPILGGMAGMSPYEGGNTKQREEVQKEPYVHDQTDIEFGTGEFLVVFGIILLPVVFLYLITKLVCFIKSRVQRKKERKKRLDRREEIIKLIKERID